MSEVPGAAGDCHSTSNSVSPTLAMRLLGPSDTVSSSVIVIVALTVSLALSADADTVSVLSASTGLSIAVT